MPPNDSNIRRCWRDLAVPGQSPRGPVLCAETFRRDGSAVSTPIWLAPAGGHWYGYTPGRSGKVRRIARNPSIKVATSDFHGQPRGDWWAGQARILPPSQLSTAKRALRTKYGLKFRLFTLITLLGRPRRHGGRAFGLEITFVSDPNRDRQAAFSLLERSPYRRRVSFQRWTVRIA